MKKDSFILGLAVGLVGPLVLFGIIYLVKISLGHLALEKAMFVSVALNIVPIRYYFITKKFDRTGRGVLTMTVFLIIMVIMIHI